VRLEDISARTKIPIHLLEDLERGDFSRWPGGIYARAYVREYASEIGLDPEATLNDLRSQLKDAEPIESIEEALAARASAETTVSGLRSQTGNILGVGACALVVMCAMLSLVRMSSHEVRADTPAATVVVPPSMAPTPPPPITVPPTESVSPPVSNTAVDLPPVVAFSASPNPAPIATTGTLPTASPVADASNSNLGGEVRGVEGSTKPGRRPARDRSATRRASTSNGTETSVFTKIGKGLKSLFGGGDSGKARKARS
jgi:cytoskeletal protein RodZ